MNKMLRAWREIRHRARLHLDTQRFRRRPTGSAQHTRLHLGCGPVRAEGYLNIDASYGASAADLVCDLMALDGHFRPGSVAAIYACHVLEHFSTEGAQTLLRRLWRLLEVGGELRLSVPDLDRIVKIYVKNWEHFQTPGNSPWVGLIYGGQGTPYDYHKTGFNFCWMKYLLEKAGFSHVEEYPHLPHPLGIVDASLAKEPFGEYLSLNVRATK
jgi:predicted SAM-dependent methyltransferase